MSFKEIDAFKDCYKKIVTAKEMARVEALAIQMRDNTSLGYMMQAAKALLHKIEKILFLKSQNKKIILLCAKGNNSGDGYALGSLLLQKGFFVEAFQITPLNESSTLCQKMAKDFISNKGKIIEVEKGCAVTDFEKGAIVIDALLGTGFHGQLDSSFTDIIHLCNRSNNYTISIDIASGIDGNDGSSSSVFINSDITYFLECPKVGHFFGDGFESYKELDSVSFSMGKEFVKKLETKFLMLEKGFIQRALPERKKSVHKYSVGQIAMLGGADSMTGAINLCALAALKSGAGIVRIFHLSKQFQPAALELIYAKLDFDHLKPFFDEMLRSKAICIGPGMGRGPKVGDLLREILSKVNVPVVLDADALYFFENFKKQAPFVLTPHEGELKHLLGIKGPVPRLELLIKAQAFADAMDVIVVCKGATTVVLAKGQEAVLIPFGNSAMATAGMGDVLSGVIASLLCQIQDPFVATVLACQIHAMAGDKAQQKQKSGLIASDCIKCLPYFLK